VSPGLSPDAPLARALERNRERFNARVSLARRQGRKLESAALLSHLLESVAPIAAAVERAAADRLDSVIETLFELSVALVSREVLGPGSRHPRAVEAWRTLLPLLANRIADEPALVVGALTNAAFNLGLVPSARAGDWLGWMREIGPRCSSVAELLACGQVLAWRCGMAHFRASALERWQQLPDPLAFATLGLAVGSSADIFPNALRPEIANLQLFGAEPRFVTRKYRATTVPSTSK